MKGQYPEDNIFKEKKKKKMYKPIRESQQPSRKYKRI